MNCLATAVAISWLRVMGEKGDRLIGRNFGTIAIEGFVGA